MESKEKSFKTDDKNHARLVEQEILLKKLTKELDSVKESDKQSKKSLQAMKIINQELEAKSNKMSKDMMQNEIIHEKEVYKLTAKVKEYKYIIHE